MVSFKTAIIASIVLIGILLGNIFFIRSVESKLLKKLDNIEKLLEASEKLDSPQISNAIHDIIDFWQDRARIAVFSVPYAQILRISEQLQSLLAYYEGGEMGELKNTKELLRLAIIEFGKMEQLLR